MHIELDEWLVGQLGQMHPATLGEGMAPADQDVGAKILNRVERQVIRNVDAVEQGDIDAPAQQHLVQVRRVRLDDVELERGVRASEVLEDPREEERGQRREASIANRPVSAPSD